MLITPQKKTMCIVQGSGNNPLVSLSQKGGTVEAYDFNC